MNKRHAFMVRTSLHSVRRSQERWKFLAEMLKSSQEKGIYQIPYRQYETALLVFTTRHMQISMLELIRNSDKHANTALNNTC